MALTYPVTLRPDDNDTILVAFPDFPEAHTFGADHDDALARAADALETVIDAYIPTRRPIPAPRRASRRMRTVALSPTASLKVEIYRGT